MSWLKDLTSLDLNSNKVLHMEELLKWQKQNKIHYVNYVNSAFSSIEEHTLMLKEYD